MLRAIRHSQYYLPPLVIVDEIEIPLRHAAVIRIEEPLEIIVSVAKENCVGASDGPATGRTRCVDTIWLPGYRIIVLLSARDVPDLAVVLGCQRPREFPTGDRWQRRERNTDIDVAI